MKDFRLILASSSPRRKALLGEAGVAFMVAAPCIPEDFHPDLSPRVNAENVALEKAKAVCGQYPSLPTLGADTIVELDGKVIGKPTGPEDAERMLASLSGREHTVITGFAIAHMDRGIFGKWSAVSKVRFKPIPGHEIKEYVAGGEPLDKAGAYAIQGGAAKWIESWMGSYTNIIGLPMEEVREALSGLGLDVFP